LWIFGCVASPDDTRKRLPLLPTFQLDTRLRQRGVQKNGYFSVPDLDKLIWDWLKDWFKEPADLRRKFESYQAERARVNAPLLELLRANDNLIADHTTQVTRAKDMYQLGVINADELLERKVRLEATIAKLEAEREKLQGRLGRELSQQQITEVIKFAEKLARGLEKADQSFEARRRIIELGVTKSG
jgi:hypothetical protein